MQQFTIENQIGVFHNVVPPQMCERIIEHYHYVKQNGFAHSRQETEGARSIDKDNETYSLANGLLFEDSIMTRTDLDFTEQFTQFFSMCWSEYTKKYPVLQTIGNVGFTGKLKIQKTEPGEGYHVWHCEQQDVLTSSRLALVMLYLNDVEEGGETEFLHQGVRVAPTVGTMVICPGGYTHTHRGNPPLKGTKFLMNTWLEFIS